MRILAFDTATPLTTVALCDVGGTLDLQLVDEPTAGSRPGHAQRLLAMIQELLDDAHAAWDSIDRIAVGTGPGTFTGMRIGIAVAQGLAASSGRPLVGVSTLRSLARSAHDHAPGAVKLAVIDARRNEAFVAVWGAGEDPLSAEPLVAPCVLTPERLASLAADTDTDANTGTDTGANAGAPAVAVGDGALRFRDQLERGGVRVPPADSPLHRVNAREHCRIAAASALPDPANTGTSTTGTSTTGTPTTGTSTTGTPTTGTSTTGAATLEPDYVRAPDAKPPRAIDLSPR